MSIEFCRGMIRQNVIKYLTIPGRMLKSIIKLCAKRQMSETTFIYNPRKALEVVLYLANRLSVPNIYRICKLLYLADKASLERYGRFIFGESYVAMEGGGTPSNVYDLLKQLRYAPTNDIKVDGNIVVALREADLDSLSQSDVECLDEIINKYGKNWSAMRNDSHDVAYNIAWSKRGTRGSKAITIESIAETFKDSDSLIDYLSNSE